MIWWWKKKKPISQAKLAAAMDWDPRGTIQPLTIFNVVDRFLAQNPAPTPFGVHALIVAGATELMSPEEVLQACEKIQEHGYQYPLNPTLQAELSKAELLGFLRWQARSDIDVEAYQNENTIRQLIERYREEASY
ncbi:MAG: hypothetical protein KDA45_00810 [Planctomycetales bacterium]|nr:hypothetical protein [Planctomycetales bacterium]